MEYKTCFNNLIEAIMSIYISITTRCNMACDHCCFACNKTEGEDMSIQTFFKAIGLAENYDEHVTLGGGDRKSVV